MAPRTITLPLLLAGVAASASAWADPPPKVCVAVAGDPDEAARAAAEALTDAIGSHRMLRGVADPDARAALRGEPRPGSPMPELSAARRSLRAQDRDADALDPVAQQLGCALFVEVAARPAGMLVRVYDAVARTWRDSREVAGVDGALVDAMIVPAALQRGAGATAADGGVTAAPARRAARATTTPAAPQRSTWQRVWPWVVVGAIAAGVALVYFTVSDEFPSSTRVTVIHGGAR